MEATLLARSKLAANWFYDRIVLQLQLVAVAEATSQTQADILHEFLLVEHMEVGANGGRIFRCFDDSDGLVAQTYKGSVAGKVRAEELLANASAHCGKQDGSVVTARQRTYGRGTSVEGVILRCQQLCCGSTVRFVIRR